MLEAAVIAVPDDRWSERPLAAVVLEPGATLTADSCAHRLASTWRAGSCPSAGPSSTRCRRRRVGKFDKKVLRKQYADGELDVEELAPPPAS